MKKHYQRLFFAMTILVITGTVLWVHGAMAQFGSGGAQIIGETRNDSGPVPYSPNEIGLPPGYSYAVAGYSKSPADQERDAKVSQVLSKYSKTADEMERTKLLEDLMTVVTAQFESRQESREKELKSLEEQVQKLRELQSRRAKEQDQIVRDRVRQLLREVDGLGWGDIRNPRGGPPGLFETR